jgi:hypothetical protein
MTEHKVARRHNRIMQQPRKRLTGPPAIGVAGSPVIPCRTGWLSYSDGGNAAR